MNQQCYDEYWGTTTNLAAISITFSLQIINGVYHKY